MMKRFPLSSRVGCSENGQIIYILLALGVVLFLTIPFVVAVGHTIHRKMTLQRAVDAAAVSSAVWQARGLNVVADLNFALVAAGGGDLVRGVVFGGADMAVYKSVLEAQDVAVKAFPGAAGWHYRQIFKAHVSDGECVPLPTGLKDIHMFSLRLRRKEFRFWFIQVDLWMEEDLPNFWKDQPRQGPFIRLYATRDKQGWPFGGGLLGRDIPRMHAVAQAAPRDGTLWDPRFSARLIPVTTDVPGADWAISH